MINSRGFTLIEMVVAIAVMGVAMTVAAMLSSQAGSSYEMARIERADELNRSRGLALLKFAYNENNRRLPVPYTGGDLTSSPANPSAGILMSFFTQQGLTSSQVNTDDGVAQRVAVYQRVPRNDNVPMFGAAGEQVRIRYDVGVVYQTNCTVNDNSCNPDSSTGLPGDSQDLTGSNYTSWDVEGGDVRPFMFSTYDMQIDSVNETASRMLAVRDSLQAYFSASQLAASPGDTTNHYPLPTGGGAPDLSGASAASNEGCENGWYQLNAGSVNVLSQIGLSPSSVYGQKVAGGAIEYCQDYDPTFAGSGALPHNGAVRINRNISTNSDPASAGGNVILSF